MKFLRFLALTVLFAVPGMAANAGAAYVSGISAGLAVNGGTSSGINTTGANLIVVAVIADSGGTATLSDSQSNSWTGLTKYTNSGSATIRLYYSVNPSTSSSHTFTISGSNTYAAVSVAAFSGAATSSTFDVQNGSTGTGTAIFPGSITPSVNNEIIVTAIGQYGNTSSTNLTIYGGFTTSNQAGSAGAVYGTAIGYLLQTTAAAANPEYTWSTSASYAVAIASFKSAAAAAATVSHRLSLLGAGQ